MIWYDSQVGGRRLHERIDLGIAVDTQDGLFVPVMRGPLVGRGIVGFDHSKIAATATVLIPLPMANAGMSSVAAQALALVLSSH